MPTTAKVVAAIFYAVLGYMLAESYRLLLPPNTNMGYANLGSAAIGVLSGWLVAGNLAGRGFARAPGMGIRTSLTIVFWALVFFSTYEMIIRSTRGRYSGSPMAALTGAFDLVIEYGTKMADQRFLILLFAGGAIGGILTEIVKRTWR